MKQKKRFEDEATQAFVFLRNSALRAGSARHVWLRLEGRPHTIFKH